MNLLSLGHGYPHQNRGCPPRKYLFSCDPSYREERFEPLASNGWDVNIWLKRFTLMKFSLPRLWAQEVCWLAALSRGETDPNNQEKCFTISPSYTFTPPTPRRGKAFKDREHGDNLEGFGVSTTINGSPGWPQSAGYLLGGEEGAGAFDQYSTAWHGFASFSSGNL